MKSLVRKIPVLRVGEYVYLFAESMRLPTGSRAEEVADLFFVTNVEGPLKYRGLLLGSEGMCRLSCVENKHGDFHVSRRYKGERNTIHYTLVRPLSKGEALEFIMDQDERLEEEAERASQILQKFRALKRGFLETTRNFF